MAGSSTRRLLAPVRQAHAGAGVICFLRAAAPARLQAAPLPPEPGIELQTLFTFLIMALFAAGAWWLRERRQGRQRAQMRALYALSEEIIAAASPDEIVRRLSRGAVETFGVSAIRLYLYNSRTQTLDRISSPQEPEPASLALDSQADPIAAGAGLCHRNRTLLAIPDLRRNPSYRPGPEADKLRAVMFVPVMAQNEALGVFELDHAATVRTFTQDEQAAAQHLANQIGTSLKLLEQQTMREQLFRSEKLAAVGQLISGVASELRAPLQSISGLVATSLDGRGDDVARRKLSAIATEATRATEILARLLSFSTADQRQAQEVDLNQLLTGLMDFREGGWKVRGIKVSRSLSRERIAIHGARSQLEQVFLNLLVHAEQSLPESGDRTFSVATNILARRALVQIEYSTRPSQTGHHDPFAEGPAEAGTLGLEVCRSIIRSHGGEIRLVRVSSRASRFEVELALRVDGLMAERAARAEAACSGRRLTALVLEPEVSIREGLVESLSERGHRVVPISAPEEAAELVHRLRFDLLLCSVHLSGSNWVELFGRVRHQVGAFVLLTHGYDEDLARALQEGQGFVLRKPIEPAEFARLLAAIETRQGSGADER